MSKIKSLIILATVVLSTFAVGCSSSDSSSVKSKDSTTTSGEVTTVTTTTSQSVTASPVETTDLISSSVTTQEIETTSADKTTVTTTISSKTETQNNTTTPKVTASVTDKNTSKITTTKATTTSKTTTTTSKKTTTAKTTTTISFEEKIEKLSYIPVISIDTNGENIVSLKEYVTCTVDVLNVKDEYSMSDVSGGIRVRGNSSAFYGDVSQILKNQVPYRIKFDKKTNMLGLNDGAKCKSWVLLKAEWNLITNDLALRFGRALFEGQDNFCSDGQLVHVYVNEKFKGIYLLCEQTQINPNRININEVEEGYTGTDIGYLLEIDNYAGSEEGEYWFDVNYAGNPYVIDIEGTGRKFESSGYTIKNDIYSQNQVDFISKYTNNVFEILYEACENENYLTFDKNYDLVQSNFDNAYDTINAVVDMESFVNMYILDEIVHDYDCGEGSFFMCVDFSSTSTCNKLRFTAPWDFNWAYNDEASYKYWAGAFCEQSFVNQYGDRTNPWYVLLMTEDWFQQLVKDRWTELKNSGVIRDCVEEQIAYIEKYKKDLCKVEDWAVDNAYSVIDWVNKRLNWLDKEWQ